MKPKILNGEACDQHLANRMAHPQFKSGTRVKVSAMNLVMTVVGYDSVGSVICEWNNCEEQPVRAYVTSAVLALADSTRQAEPT